MPNSQYPYSMQDWSSEISQPQMHSASASTSTTTTTTTSASSHSGGVQTGQPAMPGQNVMPSGMQTGAMAQSAMPSGMQTGAAAQSAMPSGMQTGAASQNVMPSGTQNTFPAVNGQMAGGSAASGQNQFTMTPGEPQSEFRGSVGTLDLQTHQPIEVIEAPADMNEAFLGSLKSMLLRNRGNFVSATFLIGTQGTTAWEGILHDVGNDYVIIFQPGRQRYIACDIYSLKYIEFYDTHRQEMCDNILRQNVMF